MQHNIMDQAIAFKREHPEESYEAVADRFTSPHRLFAAARRINRRLEVNGAFEPFLWSRRSPCSLKLTIALTEELCSPPQKVLADLGNLAGRPEGRYWTSTFIRMYKGSILS